MQDKSYPRPAAALRENRFLQHDGKECRGGVHWTGHHRRRLAGKHREECTWPARPFSSARKRAMTAPRSSRATRTLPAASSSPSACRSCCPRTSPACTRAPLRTSPSSSPRSRCATRAFQTPCRAMASGRQRASTRPTLACPPRRPSRATSASSVPTRSSSTSPLEGSRGRRAMCPRSPAAWARRTSSRSCCRTSARRAKASSAWAPCSSGTARTR